MAIRSEGPCRLPTPSSAAAMRLLRGAGRAVATNLAEPGTVCGFAILLRSERPGGLRLSSWWWEGSCLSGTALDLPASTSPSRALEAGLPPPYVMMGCVLFGLGVGNVTSLPPLIAQAEFRPADVPRVVALVTAVSQAGYAFAPTAFALIVTISGPTGLFATAAVVQLAAAATLLSIRRKVTSQELHLETTP